MATPKKRSLLALAEESKTKVPRPNAWLDCLSAEDRKDVHTVLKQIADGSYGGSITALTAAWRSAGVQCTRNKIAHAVRRLKEGGSL